MRVVSKFALAFFAASCVCLAVFTWVLATREVSRLERVVMLGLTSVGTGLRPSVEDAPASSSSSERSPTARASSAPSCSISSSPRSDAYLDARGLPDLARGCVGRPRRRPQRAVTTASDGYLDAIAPAATVSFRSNSRDALARAAAGGAGIACLPDHLGVRTPGLRRLTPPREPPARFLWLGVHADTKDVPRFRSVTRALVEGLSAIATELAPQSRASSWRTKVGAPTSSALR